jgi:hypothetical protein
MNAGKKKGHETVWFHGPHSFAIRSDLGNQIFPEQTYAVACILLKLFVRRETLREAFFL